MEYIHPSEKLNPADYECIVSFGNKCPTAMTLKDLRCYKESFPFDSIPTTPGLILKYLKDRTDFFPEPNQIRNKDGVWFGHFNTDPNNYDATVQTFTRRFGRLFSDLENKKRILFVYTSEADVYNEMGNMYLDNYGTLCEIRDYLRQTYAYDNFSILAIHINKTYIDKDCMINYRINVPERYLSNDMRTHVDEVTTEYRRVLKLLMQEIFGKT